MDFFFSFFSKCLAKKISQHFGMSRSFYHLSDLMRWIDSPKMQNDSIFFFIFCFTDFFFCFRLLICIIAPRIWSKRQCIQELKRDRDRDKHLKRFSFDKRIFICETREEKKIANHYFTLIRKFKVMRATKRLEIRLGHVIWIVLMAINGMRQSIGNEANTKFVFIQDKKKTISNETGPK